jgi:serine/alanine adding enzyme
LAAVQPELQAHGFAYEGHLDYHINLRRPMEEIFGSIGRRARKHIRHELKTGMVVMEEVTNHTQLEACYDLLRSTYHNARVPLPDCSLFDASFDLLYPKRMVRFTLATVDRAPAASSVDLFYKDVVYGWYGGVDRAHSHYQANEVLTWYLLQLSVENGYGLYDFGGAGKPGEEYGVRDFKAKFGGELVSYGRNVCVHAPLRLRLSELGYHWWRRMFL